jgi:hypothetical protein
MTLKQRKQIDQLNQVRDFGHRWAGDFLPDSPGGQAFAVVEEVVGQLRTATGEKDASTGDVSEKRTVKSAIRRTLMNDLRAMARTARIMGITRPGIESRFRLKANYSEMELLWAAKAFETGVAGLADDFIRFELAPTFLEDLRADIVAFEQALERRNAAVVTASHTQKTLTMAIARGIEAVRMLDVIVRNRFWNDDLALTAWSRAVRPVVKNKKPVAGKTERGNAKTIAA